MSTEEQVVRVEVDVKAELEDKTPPETEAAPPQTNETDGEGETVTTTEPQQEEAGKQGGDDSGSDDEHEAGGILIYYCTCTKHRLDKWFSHKCPLAIH